MMTMLLLLLGLPTVQQADLGVREWREDLRVLAAALPQRHPNPFTDVTRATWDSAVAALDARLPSLRTDQIVVELRRLVALIGDGHTAINPVFDPAIRSHHYPIDLHLFADGLYVRSAAPPYAGLVGGKVIRIGRASADEALRAVAPIISKDNEFWVHAWGPLFLTFAETLTGLGIADNPDRLPIVVEHGGRRDTTLLTPQPWIPSGHRPGGAVDRSQWVDMSGPGAPPLWRRHPDRLYWATWEPADSLLYVSYRAVQSMHDEPNPAFWDRVFRMADEHPVRRFVIDLRENSGGEGFFNLRVVRGVLARPALAGRLFVVIGPQTFSAAMNLATELERYAEPVFVGEPTGTSPHFFGDHQPLVLPHSGIRVNISTVWWQTQNPRDRRAFLAPAIYTPMTAADYRANRDPALAAIRAAGTAPALADRMAAAVARDDTVRAERLLSEARHDPANRYRDLEAEVNALGYRLLNAGRAETALRVFRINVRAYPDSPNVHDSLGEAYERAGQRTLAIAEYRRALALDPHYAPSLAGLERLGAR